MSTLDSEKASKLPEEKRDRLKQRYLTIIQGYKDTVRDTDSLNELISELTRLKDLKDKSQEETIEKQISTVRQELEELKSNQTTYSYHKRDLILTVETALQRLEKEIIDQIISQVPQEIRDSMKKNPTNIKECRNIVKCYELIPELRKMKAPINKSQETTLATFEKKISTARQELEELKSNECINSFLKRVLIREIETELLRLNEEVIDQILSQELTNSLKELYQRSFKQCMEIVSCYELIPKLNKTKAPINKNQETTFEKQISTARQELEELKSNKTINSYHKRELILKIETEFERLDKEVTDQFLNVEVWDSIDLIEKTLAEPHLYSLPHLIMWRNTAQEKI